MRNVAGLACTCILLASLLLAPTLAGEPARTQASILLRCGTLIGGVSGVERKQVSVQVEGNRIIGLRPYSPSSAQTSAANTIDLSTETCLPGLIDVHVHLIKQDAKRPEVHGNPSQSLSAETLHRTLDYGFTTVRNLGSSTLGPSDVDVRNAVEKGLLAGPRLKVALSDTTTRNFGVKGPAALRAAVDRVIAEGSDWIKVFGDMGWDDPPQYSPEELSAIVEEAHKKGVKVAMHAIGPEDNHRAIECGVDSIEHGIEIKDEDLQRMRALGIVFVPTVSVLGYAATLPGRQDNAVWAYQLSRSISTFERSLKAKVKIAFGTDAGATSLDTTGWKTANPAQQFTLMVKHNMTPMQAIFSSTRDAAQMLGMDTQIGSLEVGKFADIVAVPGDPLQDISRLEHVDFVMKDGQQIKPHK